MQVSTIVMKIKRTCIYRDAPLSTPSLSLLHSPPESTLIKFGKIYTCTWHRSNNIDIFWTFEEKSQPSKDMDQLTSISHKMHVSPKTSSLSIHMLNSILQESTTLLLQYKLLILLTIIKTSLARGKAIDINQFGIHFYTPFTLEWSHIISWST